MFLTIIGRRLNSMAAGRINKHLFHLVTMKRNSNSIRTDNDR